MGFMSLQRFIYRAQFHICRFEDQQTLVCAIGAICHILCLLVSSDTECATDMARNGKGSESQNCIIYLIHVVSSHHRNGVISLLLCSFAHYLVIARPPGLRTKGVNSAINLSDQIQEHFVFHNHNLTVFHRGVWLVR